MYTPIPERQPAILMQEMTLSMNAFDMLHHIRISLDHYDIPLLLLLLPLGWRISLN